MSSSDQSGSWLSRKMAAFSSGMAAFGKFLYDGEEGTVMGRNGSSWLRISVFYLGYYAFLAGLFAISLSVTTSMLSETEPFFQTRLQYPGMSVLPLTTKFDPAAADIIYTKSDRSTYEPYVKGIKKLLEPYHKSVYAAGINNTKVCTEPIDFKNEMTSDGKELSSCFFDTNELLSECLDESKDYGYAAGKPCIFVRLNKIINWKPVPFLDLNDPTAKGGEVSKATDLSDHLKNAVKGYDKSLSYVVCNPTEENSEGKDVKVTIKPAGISNKFFPFKGKKTQPSYKSPLVAVQLDNIPKTEKEFKMVCKVYARNLMDIMRINVGYVEFKVKVD